MDQKILSELGDYLLAHRREIIEARFFALTCRPAGRSVDLHSHSRAMHLN